MEQQNEEEWYYYYLCKGKLYLLNQIRAIDDEYIRKIESYDLGVMFYTSNFSYRFERTNDDPYIFKERANLDDKQKTELKKSKPLDDRKGYYYYYSEKDLKVECGDYPATLEERFERMRNKLEKIKKRHKKKEIIEDDSLD